jgi:uncharacterized repeat protein (TIGR01451 family)
MRTFGWVILGLLLTIQPVCGLGLVNGDFSSPGLSPSANNSLSAYAQVDTGWYTNNSASQQLQISGGVALRATTGPSAMAGIGQFFTESQTGTLKLQFDVTVVDADADLDFWVQLFGYNQLGVPTTLLAGDAMPISGMPGASNAPAGSANYSVTTLGTYYHVNGGALASGTKSFNFTGSSDYEFYGIRIIANRPDGASDSVVFDNVTITSTGGDYWWDANGAAAGIGGSGDWDTTSSIWRAPTSGGSLTTWINGNPATVPVFFGGTAGTVANTLGTVYFNSMEFQSSGYTVSGGTLSLSGSDPVQITAGSGLTATLGSVLAGTNRLVFSGGGVVVLSGANTHSGTVLLNTGTVEVASLANINTASAIGKGSVAGSSADLIIDGGVLRYAGASAQSSDRLFSLGTAGGTLDASGSGSGTISFTGTGSMGANGQTGARTLQLTGSNTGNNTLAVALLGATTVSKSGSGLWVLSGNNTYSGATTINDGVLAVSGGAAIPLGSAVTLANSAGVELRLLGGVGLQSISGGGALGGNINLNGNVLTISNSSATGISGGMTNAGTLVKLGGGTLTLGGNHNFVGEMAITGGTVQVDAALSNVTVNLSGTLSGTGAVGRVAVPGGAISPAGAGVGPLGVSALAITGLGYTWDITNATGVAGVDWDLVSISNGLGVVDLTGVVAGAINIRPSCAAASLPGFDHSVPMSWKIISCASVVNFLGNRFSVSDNNFLPGTEGGSWSITNGAEGLYLSFTPPPQTDVGVTLSSSLPQVDVGTGFSLSLIVSNKGPASAAYVAVTNRLPPGVVYVSSGSPAGTLNGDEVTWRLTNLLANTKVSLTVNLTAPLVQGVYTSSLTANRVVSDLLPADNTSVVAFTTICPGAPSPFLQVVAHQVVETGHALTFSVMASNSDCAPPAVFLASGLPSGASFSIVATNGYSLTGQFSWPSAGAAGTYPVRFRAANVASQTNSFALLIYVRGNGEGTNGEGIPLSQTNWHASITNLVAPSSGNATLVWASVNGVAYDVYTSTQPMGDGASWSKLVDAQEAVAAISTSSVASSGSMRFYQVVPEGLSRMDRGVWGIVKCTLPSAQSLLAPPLVSDRHFDGAMGAALADAVSVGTHIHIMTPGNEASWTSLVLNGSKEWRTVVGNLLYVTPLNQGQGFFVEGAAGAVPRFIGAVGNTGTGQNSIKVGYNLISLSEGRSLPVTTAFDSVLPIGNGDENQADIVNLQNANGSWRRLVRLPSGIWFDMSTAAPASLNLAPGQTYYYIRRISDTTVNF